MPKALLAFVLAAACAAAAADVAPPAPGGEIRFAKGRSTAAVSGSVLRGERAVWRFAARAGQQATLRVTAREGNAAFELWEPGAVLPSDFTVGDVTGRALSGAAPGDDATRWRGTLPADGRYLVLVGPTRGNATYRLTLELR
jgi:hypothetical protein